MGCPAAPGDLAAQTLHVGARKARNAQGRGQGSSHGSFHDRKAESCPIVTERSQEPLGAHACGRRGGTFSGEAGQWGANDRTGLLAVAMFGPTTQEHGRSRATAARASQRPSDIVRVGDRPPARR